MLCLITKNSHLMGNKVTNCALKAVASVFAAALFTTSALANSALHPEPSSTPAANPIEEKKAPLLKPFNAKYTILRKGKRYGEATRVLTKLDDNYYSLMYNSDVEFMIFSDKRSEKSVFSTKHGYVQPVEYSMQREGFGKDEDYQLKFDYQTQKATSNQSKYPIDVPWQQWQDALSYQIQARLDIQAEQTQLSYPLIDKKGRDRTYDFVVLGKETLALPYGNIETIKVKRLYDNDKRQALAWFAPELDYMLVRMWKGKEGVEQFEFQLAEVTFNE